MEAEQDVVGIIAESVHESLTAAGIFHLPPYTPLNRGVTEIKLSEGYRGREIYLLLKGLLVSCVVSSESGYFSSGVTHHGSIIFGATITQGQSFPVVTIEEIDLNLMKDLVLANWLLAIDKGLNGAIKLKLSQELQALALQWNIA